MIIKPVVTANECWMRLWDDNSTYTEWYKSASRKQRALLKKIYSMETELFGDLLFEEPLEEDLLDPDNAPLMTLDDGFCEWQPLNELRLSFEPNFENEGTYWKKLHHIVLKSDKPFDAAIHEVLHAYDDYYAYRVQLHGFWTIRLHSRLQSKIPNLDKIISQLVMVGTFGFSMEMGETHTMFFLLKSLDLDFRLNLPLGTVFGYGLAKYIAELETPKQRVAA